MDEKNLILGQYEVYSNAKEKYIDRHFTTNRFYLVLSFVQLLIVNVFIGMNMHYLSTIIAAAFGAAVTAMWWLNIDSYQFWIKIKYAKVLEYLESKLPEQPFNKEFREFKDAKKREKALVFSDFQKSLAAIIFIINLFIFVYYLTAYFTQR